ncbi:hypothetical protein VNO78_26976 [Psophocarpus tetragonolobus]|uniref:Uncharacterized protein n=1 Tax=Psophocarpus tetragonolobus TaxID=3891 RepID=A0AAN9S088_PSOTE
MLIGLKGVELWVGLLLVEYLKRQKLHRLHDVELKISNLVVTSKDKTLLQSYSKEYGRCIDIDLCAPDTLHFEQESIPDSAPRKLDAYNETACEITSRDLLNAEHEVLKSISNPSSERNDFGSAGQDVAKSMMSLLLPQAVPLLRTVSKDKELTISLSDMLPSQVNSKVGQNKIGYNLDVPSADVIMAEAGHGQQGEEVPGYKETHSNTPISEHMKSIVPDSFEYSQCDDYKTHQEILFSDIDEAVRSSFNKEMCSQQHLGDDLPKVTSTCHASGLDFKDRPQNCDVCIRDSVLDDMSPKEIIISERSDDACSDLKENPAHVDLSSVQKDLPTAQDLIGGNVCMISGTEKINSEMYSQQLLGHDFANRTSTCHALGLDFKDRPQNCDVCIADSVQDDMSPKNLIISERSNDVFSDLKENPAHVGLSSVQKDLPIPQDFTGGVSNAFLGVETKSLQLKGMETLAEKTQEEVVGKIGNGDTMIMSSELPKLVYTRKKFRKANPFQEDCSVMEYTEYDKFKFDEAILINNSSDKPCGPDNSAGVCVQTPQTSKPDDTAGVCVQTPQTSKPDDTAGVRVQTPQTSNDVLDGHRNLVLPNPTLSQNPTLSTDENKCFDIMEAQLISEPKPLHSQELKNNLGGSIKFVGHYLHPMHISSLIISTREDEILVCVLCSQLTDQYRTLFTYKVAITEPTLGCPSVMAHSSILLPDPKHNFIKEAIVERSGVQLTPGGQYIVLVGSIKTPNCREGTIDCYCSTCTSVCTEKNALKIVQVEHGYVSVITILETIDNVHCILVSEPNRLVSVGESGKLQVWVMNSEWSEKIEHFIIPADGSESPGIVELKRVPKCSHLVVGHNSCGQFSLWDIAKCNCVRSFSAVNGPINEFFPLSLFKWQTKGLGFTYASMKEQVDKLLEATNMWYSEQREICWFSPSEEDVAMWLFVSTTSELDSFHNHVSSSSGYDKQTAGSWRLALLMKNTLIFGNPLDLRTSGIGVSCGYGIVGTSDGSVYMWELSNGSKLDTLHHFQDGKVTCVATDDSRGALGVAGGGGELLLYLHLPELHSN